MIVDLYPTPLQKDLFNRCIEGYALVHDLGLNAEKLQYETYKNGLSDLQFLDIYHLQKIYKFFRRDYPLLQTVPTHSMINALISLVHGYKLFFKGAAENPPSRYYYWNNAYLSGAFSSYKPRSESSNFYFEDNYVKIEGLPKGDMVETPYHTHTTKKDRKKYINPIIFRNNYTGKYTLQYLELRNKRTGELIDIPVSDPIGVDVNKQKLYACSNGLIIPYVDTSREEKHLADINRKITWDRNKCKETGQPLSKSAIYRLEDRRIIYDHIANIHEHNCQKGALEIIRCNPEAIILEDLDIKSIMSHKYIADDLHFHPLGIAQDILEYQAYKYDIPIYYAPKGFQSSNICSNCGSYKDIKSNEYFRCDCCGLVLDRDINAAINLKNRYIQNKDNL